MSDKTTEAPDYVFSQIYVPDDSDLLHFAMRKYPEIHHAIEGIYSQEVQQTLYKTLWIQKYPGK